MNNQELLMLIQEAFYCGNSCCINKYEKEYYEEINNYPYPVELVEVLDVIYHHSYKFVIAVIKLSDGEVVGVKTEILDAAGSYWEPPDYSTDYKEVDADELRTEVAMAKLNRQLAEEEIKKLRLEIYG